MKIKIKKQDLQSALQRVQGATTERSLSHIGVRTKNNQLEVMAHDRSMAIYCTVNTEIEKEGFFFVQNRIFCDVVKELPDGEFFVESGDTLVRLYNESKAHFELKLPLIHDIDWQELPHSFADDSFIKVETQKCQYMIEQVQFCVNLDSPRNYGTVGYFHRSDKGDLRLVGTDGYRLSYCDVEMDLPESFLKDEGVCLSKKALLEFSKMCQEGFEFIELSIQKENGSMMLRLPGYQVFVRLSSIKYPNYFGVLPKGELHKIQLSSPAVQSVTKRILLTSDKTHTMQLAFAKSKLTLSSKTTGSSEGREEIDLEKDVAQDTQITINGKFLTDVFSSTSSSLLELQYKNSPTDPIVLLPETEPAGCISKHVLVPIREVHAN